MALLRKSQGFVSGQEMSGLLGVSRAAVWKGVEALRKEGYAISSVTNRGYCLTGVPAKLSAAEIRAGLEGHPWQDKVQVLETVDSTNNFCKRLAAENAPAGTVVIADRQTGGRGRMGRSFFSPPGKGIYFSIILRPKAMPGELLHLTCAFAAAMCDGVEAACGLRPKIKWTNDLILGDKKLAGLLTELAIEAESGRVQYAVLGIGVNCGERLEDFPEEVREKACSLEMILQKPVDRNRLAAELVRAAARLDETLLEGKSQWLGLYRRDCVTIGREIAVIRGEETRRGRALDVDENGGLMVRYADGTEELVASGEVSVRGMYGYV